MSAPPVAEKPTHRPGGLTIKEKIELHEKATEGSESGSGSGSVMSLSSKSKSISAAPSIAPKPAQAPPTIQRTSSSGKTTPSENWDDEYLFICLFVCLFTYLLTFVLAYLLTHSRFTYLFIHFDWLIG